jgi:excinuclease ABC subunit B
LAQARIALAAIVRHMSRMAELVIRRGLEEPDTSASFVPHKPQRPEKALGGRRFEIVSDYEPSGDQPTAIAELVASAREG